MEYQIESLMYQSRWAEALSECDRCLMEQPLNSRVHGLKGLCFYRTGEFEKAVSPLRTAVTLNPEFWEAGIKLVQCLDRLQRFEEALEVGEQFLLVKPSDPTLLHLVEGLSRHVPEKLTDAWQKSIHLDWPSVELTHRD